MIREMRLTKNDNQPPPPKGGYVYTKKARNGEIQEMQKSADLNYFLDKNTCILLFWQLCPPPHCLAKIVALSSMSLLALAYTSLVTLSFIRLKYAWRDVRITELLIEWNNYR